MKLLSAIELSSSQTAQLKACVPELDICIKGENWTAEDLQDADFAIGYPSLELLHSASHLQFLQLTASGSERYASLFGRLPMASATGAYGPIVSEYMLAALLAFYHNLHLHRNNQIRHQWGLTGPITLLAGQRVLILGTGDIGRCFAKHLKPLGAITTGVFRSKRPEPGAFDQLCTLAGLDEVLPHSDVVAICIPGTPENQRLFDLKRLQAMGKSSVLINVGRGSIVDTDALCQVLREGPLAGAILDVVDPEPLPPQHPLWEFENVLLTAHDAGNFRSMPPALAQRIGDIACQNLHRFVNHLPLLNSLS